MIRLLALCGAILMAPAAVAQSTAPERSQRLAELVDHAWARASAGRLVEGRLAEADAGRAQAESPFAGSPSLSLSTRTDQFDRNRGIEEHDVMVAAPVWLPGQRAARGALVDAEIAEAQARVEAQRLQLAGEVRERVWAVAAAESELEHAEVHAASARDLEADIARRVKAGDLPRTDLLLAQQERLIAMTAVQGARAKQAQAAARLRALTGYAALPVSYSEQTPPAYSQMQSHPRILAARLASERAMKRIRFIGSARRDAPEVGLSYRWEQGAGENGYDRSVGIGIRIPFATDARNRPLDAAAQTEAATAAAEEQAALADVEADIAAAQAALDSARANLALHEERSVSAQDRSALLKKSFDLGELPLSEYLRAHAAARGAAASMEHARGELGLAQARLNQAMGVLP
jgi:outer membrane protein, heavy metal efflux system